MYETPAQFWDRKVGPFYTTGGVARLLHTSVEDVITHTKSRDLLAVPLADGHLVYPSFQFEETPLPELSAVLDTLDPARLDSWTIAAWLVSKHDIFNGSSPAELMRSGHVAVVLQESALIAEAMRY
ncbi:hypothetical protein [Diaminobutyricimonas sp. LJ205]|uniref:hypothetical protein n=1 Tax=Diaminobutyricimonas sp. LJ205 TaxID=2683590 RepID=UPI0012F4BCC9|nr:hypothetical protein [Diaminobutyricimonas sp. LJ205]